MLPDDEIGPYTHFPIRQLRLAPDEKQLFIEFDVYSTGQSVFRSRRYYWLRMLNPEYAALPAKTNGMSWVMELNIVDLWPLPVAEECQAYYLVKGGDLRGLTRSDTHQGNIITILQGARSATLVGRDMAGPAKLAVATQDDIVLVANGSTAFKIDTRFAVGGLPGSIQNIIASADGAWLATVNQSNVNAPEHVVIWGVRPPGSLQDLPLRGAAKRIQLDKP